MYLSLSLSEAAAAAVERKREKNRRDSFENDEATCNARTLCERGIIIFGQLAVIVTNEIQFVKSSAQLWLLPSPLAQLARVSRDDEHCCRRGRCCLSLINLVYLSRPLFYGRERETAQIRS